MVSFPQFTGPSFARQGSVVQHRSAMKLDGNRPLKRPESKAKRLRAKIRVTKVGAIHANVTH